MKKVNIMGVHKFLGEGVTKNNIYGELPREEDVFFLGGGVDTSMHTMTKFWYMLEFKFRTCWCERIEF